MTTGSRSAARACAAARGAVPGLGAGQHLVDQGAHRPAGVGERLVGVGADVAEQGPPPPGVRTGVDDDVRQYGDAAGGQQRLRFRQHRHVGGLDDPTGGDARLVGGVHGVRDGGRHQYLGVGGQPGVGREFAVLGAQGGAVHGAVAVAGGEQCLDVQARGVGDGALDVGDGDDAQSGAGQEAGGGAAHGAEALHRDAGVLVGDAGPVQGGEHRFGDAAAADQLVQADAVHVDGERVGEAPPGGLLVVQERVDRLDGRDQARLGGRPVDQVLGEAEVLAGGPEVLDVGAYGAQVADEDAVGGGVAGVAVDAALGAAQRDVAALRVVVQCLLHRHAAGQAGDLLQRAAGAHPQSAAGDAAHQAVDDQVPLASGLLVGPGEGDQGRGGGGGVGGGGHRGAPRRRGRGRG